MRVFAVKMVERFRLRLRCRLLIIRGVEAIRLSTEYRFFLFSQSRTAALLFLRPTPSTGVIGCYIDAQVESKS